MGMGNGAWGTWAPALSKYGEWGTWALPITNYQLPITNYQLPITNYPLPITSNLSKLSPSWLPEFFYYV
jgi:hypothetical protein